MRADLHTHTTGSDGQLNPRELVAAAADAGLELLAVTDHDTLASQGACAAAAAGHGLRFISGIELSTTWQGVGIHVLGLNFDPSHPGLLAGVAAQQRARTERARLIAARLVAVGLEDPLAAVMERCGGEAPGRLHFAEVLVERGAVRSVAAAFRKYLGTGRAGDVKQGWADLETVIGWIHAAGGDAVLAHPGRYRLTASKRRRLALAFKAAGGSGLEVLSGQQDPALTAALTRLCRELDLAASCGSDFHRPGQPWSALGNAGPLPPEVRPIWDGWEISGSER